MLYFFSKTETGIFTVELIRYSLPTHLEYMSEILIFAVCLSSFKKKISVLPRVKRSSNVHDLTSVTTYASHGNLLRIVVTCIIIVTLSFTKTV